MYFARPYGVFLIPKGLLKGPEFIALQQEHKIVCSRAVIARSVSEEAISPMNPALRLLRSLQSLAMTSGEFISRGLFYARVSDSVSRILGTTLDGITPRLNKRATSFNGAGKEHRERYFVLE